MANLVAIETFQKNIQSLTDNNYGDFMRKSNTYFNRMLEAVGSLKEEEKKILYNIKSNIQFYPEWEIDTTLMKVLSDLKKLKELSK